MFLPMDKGDEVGNVSTHAVYRWLLPNRRSSGLFIILSEHHHSTERPDFIQASAVCPVRDAFQRVP
jgi:hypothetical protein